MKAWQIFTHSLRQVFGNFGVAVRVSLIPFLALVAVTLVFGAAIFGAIMMGNSSTSPAGIILAAIVYFVIYIAVFCAIAVNWHRFVLLNEPVNWVPTIRLDRMMAYFGTSLLISVGFGIVAGLIFGVLSVLGGLGIVLAVLIVFFLFSQFWRLSAALPGAALGQGGGISSIFAATRGETVTLLVLTLIYLGASLVVGILVGILSMIPVLGMLINLAFQWLAMMVGLSVLTTIYGHYVEKRALT